TKTGKPKTNKGQRAEGKRPDGMVAIESSVCGCLCPLSFVLCPVRLLVFPRNTFRIASEPAGDRDSSDREGGSRPDRAFEPVLRARRRRSRPGAGTAVVAPSKRSATGPACR